MTSKTESSCFSRPDQLLDDASAGQTKQARREDSARRRYLLLPALTEVALIDAEACAAPGQMSVSWWLEEVRVGRAPRPAVQKPRCTRWRLVDVRAFWSQFAESGPDDVRAAEAMKAKLVKASAKARKRRASAPAVA